MQWHALLCVRSRWRSVVHLCTFLTFDVIKEFVEFVFKMWLLPGEQSKWLGVAPPLPSQWYVRYTGWTKKKEEKSAVQWVFNDRGKCPPPRRGRFTQAPVRVTPTGGAYTDTEWKPSNGHTVLLSSDDISLKHYCCWIHSPLNYFTH